MRYKLLPVFYFILLFSSYGQEQQSKKFSFYVGCENRLPQVFTYSFLRTDYWVPAVTFHMEYQIYPQITIGLTENVAYRDTPPLISYSNTMVKYNKRLIKDYFFTINYQLNKNQESKHLVGILAGYMFVGYRSYYNLYSQKIFYVADYSYRAIGIQYRYDYKRISFLIGFYYGKNHHPDEIMRATSYQTHFDNRSGHIFFTVRYKLLSY